MAGATAQDNDDNRLQLAQEFDSEEAYAQYIVAQVKRASIEKIPIIVAPEANAEETEEEARPRVQKRFKGRRRAANPDVKVECALRRQQELRTDFRNLARPLKQVLDELGRRTTDELEANNNTHQNADEYKGIAAGLQAALDKRTALVKQADQLQHEQLRQRKEAEEAVLLESYRQNARDIQERNLEASERELLQISRSLHHAQDQNGFDTEEEGDLLPAPRHTDYRLQQQGLLPRPYGSRSREALEMEKALAELNERDMMRELLRQQPTTTQENFTVMDPTVREAAEARRQLDTGVDMLVRASRQVEGESKKRRRKTPSVLPNREASSLMALADVAAKEPNPPNFQSIKKQKLGDLPSTPARSTFDRQHLSDRWVGLGGQPGDIQQGSPQSLARPSIKAPSTHARNGSMSGPLIKDERMSSPPRYTAAPDQPPHHSGLFGQELSYSNRPGSPFNGYSGQMFGNDERYHIEGMDRIRAENRRGSESRSQRPATADRTPRQPLASPFTHPASLIHPTQTIMPSGQDMRFSPFNFAPRGDMPPPPPMLPTAQPIDHFAKQGIRNSFPSSSIPPPPLPMPPNWATGSPLVSIPQGIAPSQLPPFPPYPPQQSILQAPQAMPSTPTTAGPQMPVLAPAGSQVRSAHPAFAQQAERQEQIRRKATADPYPKFKHFKPATKE